MKCCWATATVGTTAIPDNSPVQGGAWTTRPQRGQGKASIGNSHERLEDQASRETRETFGEDFCQQLETEQQAIRHANEGRARISREAGCSPMSPLSSPSLGDSEAQGNSDETMGERATQGGLEGPNLGDWLW